MKHNLPEREREIEGERSGGGGGRHPVFSCVLFFFSDHPRFGRLAVTCGHQKLNHPQIVTEKVLLVLYSVTIM